MRRGSGYDGLGALPERIRLRLRLGHDDSFGVTASERPQRAAPVQVGLGGMGFLRQELDALGYRFPDLRRRARDRVAEVDQGDETLVLGEADRGPAFRGLEQLRRAPVGAEASSVGGE